MNTVNTFFDMEINLFHKTKNRYHLNVKLCLMRGSQILKLLAISQINFLDISVTRWLMLMTGITAMLVRRIFNKNQYMQNFTVVSLFWNTLYTHHLLFSVGIKSVFILLTVVLVNQTNFRLVKLQNTMKYGNANS